MVIQGLIFALLLFYRFKIKGKHADLLIALVLTIMAYHRSTYTIGFMGWYDTFKNTKINYYLLPLGLSLGPLIYLYVRTTVVSPFKLIRRDLWHFLPVSIYVIYKMTLLIHDARQPDWNIGYTGEWMGSIDDVYVDPIMVHMNYSSQLVYLAFTIQLFLQYRTKIKQYFSTTYRVELNWIRNFLAIYTFLFIYGTITDLVDAYITDLDYVHRWWLHLFSAIAIVYLGIKAYFTDLNGLHGLTFEMSHPGTSHRTEIDTTKYLKEKNIITTFIEGKQIYLNPDVTLKDLAVGTNLSIHDVSETINKGLGKNFNELINDYRVATVKAALLDEKKQHLSLVAIAYDCGFNSKATFNRVFKKHTGQSPSQYRSQGNRTETV